VYLSVTVSADVYVREHISETTRPSLREIFCARLLRSWLGLALAAL